MTHRKRPIASAIAAGIILFSTMPSIAQADAFVSPDIIVLGDSQISFGSGPVFVDFASDLMASCDPNMRQKRQLKKLGDMSVGVIGVRSSSIHSWTARSGAAKGSICDVDPKWKVNAGSYGAVNRTENPFVQIGRGRNYQFCKAGQSPFEAMLREEYYAPKLLILSFLGNAARRWADNPDLALSDVRKLDQHLPEDLPCVFMTTAPAHTKKIEKLRTRAQANIKQAFAKTGNRCSFVEGITPETIAVNQSTPRFFRRHENGRVKDPYHPNERGARHHFEMRGKAMCDAIFSALSASGERS